MMSIKKTSALIATVVGMTFAGSALAADGTITINGMITDTTCSINVGGQGENATVTLPTVSTSALSAAGDVAGATPYSISLSGCTGTTMSTASTFYEAGTYTDSASGRLTTVSGAGQATNVQVQLLNANLLPIKAGNAVSSLPNGQNDVAVDISSGAGTMNYYARYYATGATTSGVVSTQVDYSIAYD